METLLSPLRELDEYNQLKIAVEKGVTPVNVIGSIDAQKCHFIYGLEELGDVRLIIHTMRSAPKRLWRITACMTGMLCIIRRRI